MTSSDLPGEDALIARLAAQLPPPQRTRLAIGDDAAAILQPDGSLRLITTDLLMEGVHFRLAWGDLPALGWKALAQNLSDIAAMGGEPTHAVIAIALPPDWTQEQAADLYRGIGAMASQARIDIAGGDTVRSTGPLVISITVLGMVAAHAMLTRAGARPGDAIFVTGTLGRAAAGLRILDAGLPISPTLEPAVRAQLRPEPRLDAGRLLAGSGLVTAMMDLSDGVATDLHRLCRASGVGAIIDRSLVPVDPVAPAACRQLPANCAGDPMTLALAGGEDFELLFTAAPTAENLLGNLLAPLPVTRIGRITVGEALLLQDGMHTEPLAWGFTHF